MDITLIHIVWYMILLIKQQLLSMIFQKISMLFILTTAVLFFNSFSHMLQKDGSSTLNSTDAKLLQAYEWKLKKERQLKERSKYIMDSLNWKLNKSSKLRRQYLIEDV